MPIVKQITGNNNEIYQLVFLKEAVLNCSSKGEMPGSFCKAPCPLPSVSKKSAKLKCLSKLL